MKNKKLIFLIAIPFFLILIGIYLFYEPVLVSKKTILSNKETGISTNNWMKNLDGNLRLSEINIPGVHDAATNHVQLSFFSKCQSYYTYDLLNSGFRYLDIRLGIEQDKNGVPEFKLMHGFTSCKDGVFAWSKNLYLEKVLNECYKFLQENPSESIIMCIKQEHGKETIEEFQKGLYKFINEKPEFWYLKNKDAVLNEVRGKIVLAHRYHNDIFEENSAGLDLIWIDQPKSQVKDLIYEDNSYLNNHPLFVQDHYEYSRKDKWNVIEKGIPEIQKLPGFVLTFLSTKGTPKYGHPFYYARNINHKFIKMEMTKNQKYGYLIFDFGNAKLAQKVIETNF